MTNSSPSTKLRRSYLAYISGRLENIPHLPPCQQRHFLEKAGVFLAESIDQMGSRTGLSILYSRGAGTIRTLFSMTSTLLKAPFEMLAGVPAGLAKITTGIFTFNATLLNKGAGDLLSPVFSLLIQVPATLIHLLQNVFCLQAVERRLNETELILLYNVFRDALDYRLIRIISGRSGLFGLNRRPFSLGNTIFMKSAAFPPDLLVHEAVHTWQYQHLGCRYVWDAVSAQWFLRDEYNWEREMKNRGKTDWSQFNPEAQAMFIQDCWRYGELRDKDGMRAGLGNGSFFEACGSCNASFVAGGTDYSGIARQAIETLRLTRGKTNAASTQYSCPACDKG